MKNEIKIDSNNIYDINFVKKQQNRKTSGSLRNSQKDREKEKEKDKDKKIRIFSNSSSPISAERKTLSKDKKDQILSFEFEKSKELDGKKISKNNFVH